MRHLFTLCAFLFLVASCKKETTFKSDSEKYLETVKGSLKDSLSVEDFQKMDFAAAVLSKVDSAALYFLRIPVKGKSIATDFVLVQTNQAGKVSRGRMVSLYGETPVDGANKHSYANNGHIVLRSLKGETLVNSKIVNGFIVAFHPQRFLQRTSTPIQPAPKSKDLPEVIVVAFVNRGGISPSDWLLLQGIFGGGGSSGASGGSTSGYYVSASNSGSASGEGEDGSGRSDRSG